MWTAIEARPAEGVQGRSALRRGIGDGTGFALR